MNLNDILTCSPDSTFNFGENSNLNTRYEDGKIVLFEEETTKEINVDKQIEEVIKPFQVDLDIKFKPNEILYASSAWGMNLGIIEMQSTDVIAFDRNDNVVAVYRFDTPAQAKEFAERKQELNYKYEIGGSQDI